jgi:hypothetical protein
MKNMIQLKKFKKFLGYAGIGLVCCYQWSGKKWGNQDWHFKYCTETVEL